jgi:LemA protein
MGWIALAVVAGIVVIVALMVVGLYNSLVRKRQRCLETWSQIDVQLKRRHDLIPNLVETVKGYAAHERGTLERVVQARNAAVAASGGDVKAQAGAENILSGALRQLFALAESYPNLKANENFAQLQGELAETENRISAVRQQYNAAALDYNTARQTFPGNIVAGAFGFEGRDYFEVEDEAQREVPKVQF